MRVGRQATQAKKNNKHKSNRTNDAGRARQAGPNKVNLFTLSSKEFIILVLLLSLCLFLHILALVLRCGQIVVVTAGASPPSVCGACMLAIVATNLFAYASEGGT
jgi:hypothetical protein